MKEAMRWTSLLLTSLIVTGIFLSRLKSMLFLKKIKKSTNACNAYNMDNRQYIFVYIYKLQMYKYRQHTLAYCSIYIIHSLFYFMVNTA